MAKFEGRPGDMTWGRYDYPVTRTQCETLDGAWFLLTGLPISRMRDDAPRGVFYSQTPDGMVVIGKNHRSINVDRNGRVTGNFREGRDGR